MAVRAGCGGVRAGGGVAGRGDVMRRRPGAVVRAGRMKRFVRIALVGLVGLGAWRRRGLAVGIASWGWCRKTGWGQRNHGTG